MLYLASRTATVGSELQPIFGEAKGTNKRSRLGTVHVTKVPDPRVSDPFNKEFFDKRSEKSITTKRKKERCKNYKDSFWASFRQNHKFFII